MTARLPVPPSVDVSVLVPTADRPAALALTLAGILGQSPRQPHEVVVSDQGRWPATDAPEVRAVLRLLDLRGVVVRYGRHLPRRGLAEHRAHLLGLATQPLVLFLDDDVYLEPHVLHRLARALRRERCGFVGAFVEAPGAVSSDAPADVPAPWVRIQTWDGPVRPERVVPGSQEWERRHVHFAAHLHRVARRQGLLDGADHLYKVAWVGGCILYDREALVRAGGFDFWTELPVDHVGEDVLAQLRVMATSGGAGLLPSGAWHLEVPTTLGDRRVDAPLVLPVLPQRIDERAAG